VLHLILKHYTSVKVFASALYTKLKTQTRTLFPNHLKFLVVSAAEENFKSRKP
jgi:hypothetical protein